MNGFLAKPFKAEQLAEILEPIAAARRARPTDEATDASAACRPPLRSRDSGAAGAAGTVVRAGTPSEATGVAPEADPLLSDTGSPRSSSRPPRARKPP